MQTHKLLLPVNGRRVIDGLLDTLLAVLPEVFILVRQGDRALLEAVAGHPAACIVEAATDPPDMRASVELLLREIDRRFSPSAADGWLLTPADHPVVQPAVVRTIVEGFRAEPNAIHLPTFEGRGGHPTLFPWPLARRVGELPDDAGLNVLRRLPGVLTSFHPTAEPSVLWDLDTPEDYKRLLATVAEAP